VPHDNEVQDELQDVTQGTCSMLALTDVIFHLFVSTHMSVFLSTWSLIEMSVWKRFEKLLP